MKKSYWLIASFVVLAGWQIAKGLNEDIKESFNEIWSATLEKPYPARQKNDPLYEESPQVLPQYLVASKRFRDPESWNLTNVNFLIKAAKRTFENRRHLVDFGGPKMVHSNGACFAGEWHITRQGTSEDGSAFTGALRKGVVGRVIARASVATSETIKNNPKNQVDTKFEGNRAFGIALAVFFNPADQTKLVDPSLALPPEWIANGHYVDNLGGADADHFTRVSMSNKPILPGLKNLVFDTKLLLRTKRGLEAADKPATERQNYPFSLIGVKEDAANSPAILAFSGLENPDGDEVLKNLKQDVDRDDFRNELNPALRENGHLYFGIYVRSAAQKVLEYVGYMDFDKDHFVNSEACDQRFHVPHALWRK